MPFASVEERREYLVRVEAESKSFLRLINDPDQDPVDLTRALVENLVDLAAPYGTGIETLHSPEKRYQDFLAEFEAIVRNPGAIGYPSGFTSVDSAFLGLRKRMLIILAGRTGIGKTVMMSQIARYVAKQERFPCHVLYVSPEQSDPELRIRAVAAETNVSHFKILTGLKLEPKDIEDIKKGAYRALCEPKLWVFDQSHCTVETVREAMHLVRAQLPAGEHLGLVVVDYLQRMSAIPGKARNEYTAAHVHAMKDLAKDEEVCVLLGSQFSRLDGDRPDLDDLRMSGDIEQEADQVLSLWHEAGTDKSAKVIPTKFECLKNRHGRTFVDTIDLITHKPEFKERRQEW